MESRSVIALAPSQGSQGGHVLLHIQLVGHGVRRLEQAGEARQELKLHSGGPSACHRGVHPALDGVFFHGMEEGQRVLRGRKAVEDGEVTKGFIHDADDVYWPLPL